MSRWLHILMISIVPLGIVTSCVPFQDQTRQPEISTVDIFQFYEANKDTEARLNEVVLEIEIERTCFDMDDPLPLEITLRNISDSAITVAKTLRFVGHFPFYGSWAFLNSADTSSLSTVIEVPWLRETEYVTLFPNEGTVTYIENFWELPNIEANQQQREAGHYELMIRYRNFIPGIVLSSKINDYDNRLFLTVKESGVWIGELYSNQLSFDVVASAEECNDTTPALALDNRGT